MHMQGKRFAYEGIEIGGPRHFYRQELIVRFLEEGRVKGRVLDAGCGDGCVSLKLAEKGWQVYALDYSLEFLDILKERLKKHNLSGKVEIVHSDLGSLDFSDSFFDAVVCGEVLEHMPDDRRIISSFNRILRPGGVCVVSVPVLNKGWDPSDKFFGHERLYDIKSLKRLAEESGFSLEKYLCWGFPLMKIYYRLIYLNWFKSVGNYEEGQKNIVTRIGKSRFISFIGGQIFRFDEIFGKHQWGIGLVARLKKISNRQEGDFS
jgi:ubiquinone/menaquinone biosynthesis C-methylase UbiE